MLFLIMLCTFLKNLLAVSENCRNFALDRSRRRFSSARNVAYQGGPFFVYRVMEYTKQLLTLQQQIDVLKKRGLQIDNEAEAKDMLDTISYFRLAGYWRLMEADKVRHIFKPGSKFSQIISLYHFDEELRLLLFSSIQQIEVAVRARMIRLFAERQEQLMGLDIKLNNGKINLKLRWDGRNPDEEEDAYRRRCLLQASKMVSGNGVKRKR